MSRKIGIRGLDITMVWHPGWPIAHPLVAEGRAPCSGRIFDIFTGSRQTTEDDYQLWTAEHPFTEGVRPMIPG